MRDIIGEMRWGMMGCGMRDEPPPRNRPGRAAVFLASPPPTHGNHKTGAGKDQLAEKRMLIFHLNC